MAHALLGAVSCGRCGARVGPVTARCGRCGSPRLHSAPGTATGPYQGMLIDVVPASATKRYGSAALDAVPVLALVALTIASAVEGRAPLLTAAVVAALGTYVAAVAATSIRTGQTPGRRVLGLRTVDDLSGTPLTVADRIGRIPHLLRLRTTMTADLGAGRDPLSVARTPAATLGDGNAEIEETIDIDPGAIDTGRGVARRRALPGAADETVTEYAVLVLDSGERIPVTSPLVIGRKPEAQVDGITREVYVWPDLSRTVAKSHALFTWSGSTMWVTDLGGPHGTAIITPDGERRPLVERVPTAAGVGWVVELGRRRATIDAGPRENHPDNEGRAPRAD